MVPICDCHTFSASSCHFLKENNRAELKLLVLSCKGNGHFLKTKKIETVIYAKLLEINAWRHLATNFAAQDMFLTTTKWRFVREENLNFFFQQTPRGFKDSNSRRNLTLLVFFLNYFRTREKNVFSCCSSIRHCQYNTCSEMKEYNS